MGVGLLLSVPRKTTVVLWTGEGALLKGVEFSHGPVERLYVEDIPAGLLFHELDHVMGIVPGLYAAQRDSPPLTVQVLRLLGLLYLHFYCYLHSNLCKCAILQRNNYR